MVTIGYLHYRKNPVKLKRAYAFAAVAKAEGARLLYFSPGAVDFQKRKITGYVYGGGEWRRTVSEFPDVVYNSVGFAGEKQNEIIDRLMEEVPFTSHSIGSKLTVFNNLARYGEFSRFLIPSEKVLSAGHFFELVDKYGKIVFKPSSGCQGADVYRIEKVDGYYEILAGDRISKHDAAETAAFVSDKTAEDAYLVQPYINCRTKSGDPYDLRLHTQKTPERKWVTVKTYPRVCAAGSIACNLHGGGYTTEPDIFFEKEFGDGWPTEKKRVEDFALALSAHMDKIQKELYGEELDELGIDIGLDENRKICVYEINWRPGYPPAMIVDLTPAKNIIRYSMLLAAEGRDGA